MTKNVTFVFGGDLYRCFVTLTETPNVGWNMKRALRAVSHLSVARSGLPVWQQLFCS